MIKITLKIIGILLGIAASLVVVAFIAMSIFNSPAYAWRILRYVTRISMTTIFFS